MYSQRFQHLSVAYDCIYNGFAIKMFILGVFAIVLASVVLKPLENQWISTPRLRKTKQTHIKPILFISPIWKTKKTYVKPNVFHGSYLKKQRKP